MEILNYFKVLGSHIANGIRGNMQKKGVNVTGQTSRSLRWEARQEGTDTRLTVIGSGVLLTLETGRGPTKNSGGGNLFDRILRWAIRRGLPSLWGMNEDSVAFIITRAIHERGTLTYQKYKRTGKGSGVITDVLNENELKEISKKVLKLGGQDILNRQRVSLRGKG